MSEKIDSRVTADLHPGVVSALDSYDDDTAGILGQTEAAFSTAYHGIGKVHDARAAAASNPAWTEAAQLIETQNFADKMFAAIAKRFDSAASNLKTIINGIEKDLSAPVESKAAHAIASEIRAHAKSLKTSERMGFIQRAITDGDERTATAILGAPAYLSGIDSEMQSVLTRMYHEHHHPLQAKRLKAARAGLDLIGERSALIFGDLEKAVGGDRHKIAKLRAAKTAAEQAFVISSN